MKFSKAVWICAAWFIAALLFNAGIYFVEGEQKALEFFTGYVIELSLSIDNLFVFFLIFSRFNVESSQQNKILRWGVLGAQLMRAVFILGGVALLKNFSWVIYAFGILLVFSGFKLFFKKGSSINFDGNFLKRFIPWNISSFWIVLIVVEMADLVFAMDSIPAVLAVTKDPFIVYSSNIFAILGLRSMYFVLSPVIDMFQFLHFTLGIILVFVGIKMLTDHIWHIPTAYALGFIILVLTVFSFTSFFINMNKKKGGDMNRLFIIFGLLLVLIVPQAWGETSQYPNPYRQTLWNNITDNVHTLGQNPYQKKRTLQKLHKQRTKARLNDIKRARRRAAKLNNNH